MEWVQNYYGYSLKPHYVFVNYDAQIDPEMIPSADHV